MTDISFSPYSVTVLAEGRVQTDTFCSIIVLIFMLLAVFLPLAPVLRLEDPTDVFPVENEHNFDTYQGLQPVEFLFLTSVLKTWPQDGFLLKKG
jgi:hypothetical protein